VEEPWLNDTGRCLPSIGLDDIMDDIFMTWVVPQVCGDILRHPAVTLVITAPDFSESAWCTVLYNICYIPDYSTP
jgi:hypothetical protein